MQQYIEFKKQRELGEILSDTFKFLRSEFKPFFSTYFKIVGPYLLGLILFLGGYFYFTFSSIGVFQETEDFLGYNLIVIIVLLLAAMGFGIIFAVTSKATVLFYIQSYIRGQGKIDETEVRKSVYRNFWNFFGLMILVGLASMFGLALCFFPYIYLWPVLTLPYAIYVFTNKGAIESIEYAFKLIKDNWWITFATLFVCGIIFGIMAGAMHIPSIIYQMIKMMVFINDMDAESIDQIYDPILIILTMLGYLFQYLATTLMVIVSAFIYFNLNEKKNFTGTYERIENLGKS